MEADNEEDKLAGCLSVPQYLTRQTSDSYELGASGLGMLGSGYCTKLHNCT